jgi:NitT/TauT family transport system substrate-binding protein
LKVSRVHALIGIAAAIAAPACVRAQTPSVMRIGTPGNDGNALAYYAFENGYFRNDGIAAQIQTIRAGSGSGVAGAVVGGALDVGEGDIIAVAAAREHGLPPVSALIVAKASAIRNGRDLNGATIAVPSLTGPAKLVTVAWLQKNGADLTSLKFVELPQTAMAAAIARGTVAAATTTEPNLAASLDVARVLGYVYDAIGNPLQVSGWFATEDWIRANTDVARRFDAAIHDAAVWANKPQNRAASAAILQKYTPFASDLLPKMHRSAYGEVFDTTLMQPLLDAAYEQKSLQRRAVAKDLLSPIALVR